MYKSINERETPKVVEQGRFHQAIDWLYARHGIVLTLGIAFQLIVLMTMIVPPLTTKLTGDTVLLRIAPVDPRDFFRGDYVILSYDFSQLPVNAIAGTQAYELQGKMVFVSIELDSDGKHWRASSFKLEKPTTGKFLCGRIKGGNQIEFGIESFFVQQGQGLQ